MDIWRLFEHQLHWRMLCTTKYLILVIYLITSSDVIMYILFKPHVKPMQQIHNGLQLQFAKTLQCHARVDK